DDHQRLEIAQILVGAPVLGEFDRGAHQLATVHLELAFEPLEQGKGIGGRPGEAGDHAAIPDPADLAGVRLHHRVAHGNLPVTGDDGAAVLLHPDDGGAVPLDQAVARPALVHGAEYGNPAGTIKRSDQLPFGPVPPPLPPVAPGTAPTAPMLPNRSSKKLRLRPSVGVLWPSGSMLATCSIPAFSTVATLPALSKVTLRMVCATGLGRSDGACFVSVDT